MKLWCISLVFSSLLCSGLVQAGVKLNVILVRHGYALSNQLGVYNTNPKNEGYRPMPLTTKGIQQARDAGDRLNVELKQKNLKISAIYSSILPRAVETAEIMASRLDINDLTLIKVEDLIENNMGKFEGKKYDTFPYRHDDLSHNHDDNIQGETLEDVRKRLKGFLSEIILELPEGETTIMLVTHGTPGFLISEILGFGRIYLDNAEYRILSING